MRHFVVLLLVCVCCFGCGDTDETPLTLIKSGYDEQEMEAAIARSRKEIDTFLAELSKRTGENHAVKAPITDKGETEHFWLVDVSYRNGQFEGVINNDPGMVTNVRIGYERKVDKADISDWMFMRGGKMYGNYTLRPLLRAMPKEEAEMYRSMFANP